MDGSSYGRAAHEWREPREAKANTMRIRFEAFMERAASWGGARKASTKEEGGGR